MRTLADGTCPRCGSALLTERDLLETCLLRTALEDIRAKKAEETETP